MVENSKGADESEELSVLSQDIFLVHSSPYAAVFWEGLRASNAHIPPECDGAIIRVDDPFTVVSEKTEWHQ